jgi:hypothetical protein
MKKLWLFLSLGVIGLSVDAQFGPSPYQVPTGLVHGAAFRDLIRPIPLVNGLDAGEWGAEGVRPREAQNGLEDTTWSYWCTSGIRGPDGREHLFVCRWREDSPKGHREWPRSLLARAVSDSPTGPFTVVQEIGPGHNAEVYQAKDGTYVVYVINNSYQAKSLEGPWTPVKLQFDLRGLKAVDMSNCTFTRREDGSFLMVSRTGEIWVSPDGLRPYLRLSEGSVYPAIKGAFEDPVVWRDEVQYHLIVNDWYGRTAYYLRSDDGVHWVWDAGKAYDQDVVRHPDGKIEQWHKLERPKVRQDEYGRATHLYLAGVDVAKEEDFGSDQHSSKSLVLPLTVGRRLAVLGERALDASTRVVRVEIRAEPGFDPLAEVAVDSLAFGGVAAVNFGRGARAIKSEKVGANLVVSFAGSGLELGADDFAAKLLGRTRGGELLFGYARLPGRTSLAPLLRTRVPTLTRLDNGSIRAELALENFGQVAAGETALALTFLRAGQELCTTTLLAPGVAPYAATQVVANVNSPALVAGETVDVRVVVDPDARRPARRQTPGLVLP